MGNAQYVNQVGKLVNDSTKYNVDIDNLSVTNIVLIAYLESMKPAIPVFQPINLTEEETWTDDEIRDRLNQYIHCLKKEMNFYEGKVIVDNCVLTETDGNVKLEDNLNPETYE